MSKIIDAGHGISIQPSTLSTPGGAPAHYRITGFDTSTNQFNHMGDGFRSSYHSLPITFVNGQTPDGLPNGITMETLLMVVRDRLEAFQAGPFPHPRNEVALQNIDAALLELALREKEIKEAASNA